MSGTALLIAIALLLAGFTPTQAQTARDTEPKHAYYLGEIGRALGLAPLWTADDPPSRHQEIRIWIGFGLFAPQTFTQIESDGNSVRGRKIFWWTAATDSAEEAAAGRRQSPRRSELVTTWIDRTGRVVDSGGSA